MRKVALRGLLAHKLRLGMTVLSVALGVAFVSGVLTFTDTMEESFDDLFATVYDGTDAVVRSDETVGGDFEEQRGTLDDSLLEVVRDVPTVGSAVGETEGFVQIIDQEGETIGGGFFGSPTFASSYDPDQADNGDDLNLFGLRDGDWPSADDEIVMDVATARDNDFSIGDTVSVQTSAGAGQYELVGTVRFGTRDNAAGNSVVLFTLAEAQRTVGEPGRYNTISVVAQDDTPQPDLARDIQDALVEAGAADGVEVLTGDEMVDETQSDVRQGLSFLTIFFLVFAVIAVIVGSFVIYNSFSIIIAQRTREMALLRAVGASRRQVRRSVFLEAVAIGLGGSAVGLVIGLGIASVLGGLLEVEGSLVVLPATIVTALIVGLVVTVSSSLLPAWRASRVAPVAAMRDVDVDITGRSRVRLVVGAVLVGLGVLVAVVGSTAHEVAQVGYGVGIVFVGLIFLAPGVSRPVSRALGWPLGRLRGVTGTLARQNASRNPRRTASTGMALMIGVGIVAFFLVLNASLRSSFDKVLEDNFAGDFVIDSGGFGMIGLPDQVAQDVEGLQEVEDAVPLRFETVEDSEGSSRNVTGTAPAAFDAFSMEVAGSADLGPGEIFVEKDAAESRGLDQGDDFDLAFLDSGTATFTVAGTFEGSPATLLSDYVVGTEELARHVPGSQDEMIVVELTEGASADDARTAIEGVVEPISPTADVQDEEDVQEQLASQLDNMLLIVLVLLLFAITIAGIGIMNTIGLSVMERTRELGLLRAVGMSRRQLRSAIRWESVIVALFGTVLGMAVGVLGSWGMVTALEDEGFEVFTLPLDTLVFLAVLAGGLGLLAAMWPAWRAGRLNVLDAVHHE